MFKKVFGERMVSELEAEMAAQNKTLAGECETSTEIAAYAQLYVVMMILLKEKADVMPHIFKTMNFALQDSERGIMIDLQHRDVH